MLQPGQRFVLPTLQELPPGVGHAPGFDAPSSSPIQSTFPFEGAAEKFQDVELFLELLDELHEFPEPFPQLLLFPPRFPFLEPEPQLHTDVEPGFVVCQLPSHPFAPQAPGHLFRASMSFQIGPALTSPLLAGSAATRRIKPASTITNEREMRTIGLLKD